MCLQDVPGAAFEVHETRNQSTSKSEDEILGLRHGGNGAAVDEHIANHAAAE